MLNHRRIGFKSPPPVASQREGSSDIDDEYNVDVGMVNIRKDSDCSGPEIDSDEDEPARETLTDSAYGRRPEGQQSKVPRLPKKFLEPSTAKNQGHQQQLALSARRGRGRGRSLPDPKQYLDADAFGDWQGINATAKQTGMPQSQVQAQPMRFFLDDRPEWQQENLDLQSEESFPTLSSSSSSRSAEVLTSRGNSVLPTIPRRMPRPQKPASFLLDRDGSRGSKTEMLNTGFETAGGEGSGIPVPSTKTTASSAQSEDSDGGWCVVEPPCLQIDGLPMYVDDSDIRALFESYGEVKALEKTVQKKRKLASIRIRYKKESVRDWVVESSKDIADGILSAEDQKKYAVTIKPIDAAKTT